MIIKVILLSLVMLNDIALGSAAQTTDSSETFPEENFVFLITFDEHGNAIPFLFNKKESTKRLFVPKSPHSEKIVKEKINLALQAIKDMATYPTCNQFIVESSGIAATLYPKQVLTIVMDKPAISPSPVPIKLKVHCHVTGNALKDNWLQIAISPKAKFVALKEHVAKLLQRQTQDFILAHVELKKITEYDQISQKNLQELGITDKTSLWAYSVSPATKK